VARPWDTGTGMALRVVGVVPDALVQHLAGLVAQATTAVAVWGEQPTPDSLLADRLTRGWRPTPSSLAEGNRVVGHAAGVPRDRWTTPDSP
jgi:hypothetical protein